MPIYEYICEDCKVLFEKIVHNGDAIECPKCGGQHHKQQLSVFAAPAKSGKAESSSSGCCNPARCGCN